MPTPASAATDADDSRSAGKQLTTYYAGTGVVTAADGKTASVTILLRRIQVPETSTTEERLSQVGEPLIPCLEDSRTLVRNGNRLTVTFPATGRSGEGIQEGSARWSWQVTAPNGFRTVSVAELTPSGQLRALNRQLDASGRQVIQASGTYAPVTREEYDRQREAFRQRCAPKPEQ